jgi:hypothetical protein
MIEYNENYGELPQERQSLLELSQIEVSIQLAAAKSTR